MAWLAPLAAEAVVICAAVLAYIAVKPLVESIEGPKALGPFPPELSWRVGSALAFLLWGVSWIALNLSLAALIAFSTIVILRTRVESKRSSRAFVSPWFILAPVGITVAFVGLVWCNGRDFGPSDPLTTAKSLLASSNVDFDWLTAFSNATTVLAVALLSTAFVCVLVPLCQHSRSLRALTMSDLESATSRLRTLLYCGAVALVAGAIEVQSLYGTCAAVANTPVPTSSRAQTPATNPPPESKPDTPAPTSEPKAEPKPIAKMNPQAEQYKTLSLGLGGCVGAAFSLLLTALYLPGALMVKNLAERLPAGSPMETSEDRRKTLVDHGLASDSAFDPLKRILAAVAPLLATILTASVLEVLKHLGA